LTSSTKAWCFEVGLVAIEAKSWFPLFIDMHTSSRIIEEEDVQIHGTVTPSADAIRWYLLIFTSREHAWGHS